MRDLGDSALQSTRPRLALTDLSQTLGIVAEVWGLEVNRGVQISSPSAEIDSADDDFAVAGVDQPFTSLRIRSRGSERLWPRT